MNNIIANVSAGGVILNDYIIKIEDIPGGHRLRIARGSEVQVLEIMDHDLTIDGGKPGQVVGFNELGAAVPMDPPGQSALYVNLTPKDDTPDRYTADTNKSEIGAAYESGRAVYCVIDGHMLPLNKVAYYQQPNGETAVDTASFVGFIGAAYCSIDMFDPANVDVQKYGIAVQLNGVPVVIPTLSSNAGKLMYVDASGQLSTLAVDNFGGLQIDGGKLTIGAMSRLILYDEIDNKNYRLNVQGGELTMTEVE